MAESKGALLAKSFSKHAVRAKEKLLQNLGRVDRTFDDIFDEHLENFNRQQSAAARFQKEFNNYLRCVRAVQGASKSLFECMNEMYESGWTGQDLLFVQGQNVEMLWQDLSHKLADQVLVPLNTYHSQFPEMKKKIEKRCRKLVDYDGHRHHLQALEGNGKKRDEAKQIQKAKEQMQLAKRTYDSLNSELHDDLPALHHSRILFLVNNLQTLFSAEQVFHSETSKVYSELEAIIDKLATETQKQSSFSSQKVLNSPQTNSLPKVKTPGSPSSNADDSSPTPPDSPKEVEAPENVLVSSFNSTDINSLPDESPVKESNTPNGLSHSNQTNSTTNVNAPSTTVNGNGSSSPPTTVKEANNNLSLKDWLSRPEAPSEPGVLYRVRATYRYNREDVDELSFEVGEIIKVVQYEDPEEQEEGWLMGIKETTGEKGMFPANFTQPL